MIKRDFSHIYLRPMLDKEDIFYWELMNPILNKIEPISEKDFIEYISKNSDKFDDNIYSNSLKDSLTHWHSRGWGKSLDAYYPTLCNGNHQLKNAKLPQKLPKLEGDKEKIILAKPLRKKNTVTGSLHLRRTYRRFNNEPIDINSFSELLYFSINKNLNDLKKYFSIYISIFSIESIEPGVYKYDFNNHFLELICKGAYRGEVSKIIQGLSTPMSAGFTIFLTADLHKAQQEVSAQRALRDLYFQSGTIVQNIISYATTLSLGVLPTPALNDSLAEKLLQLNTPQEIAVYSATIGWATSSVKSVH